MQDINCSLSYGGRVNKYNITSCVVHSQIITERPKDFHGCSFVMYTNTLLTYYIALFALTIGGNVSITCHTESPKESSASDRIAFMNSIGISSEKMQCIFHFKAIFLRL